MLAKRPRLCLFVREQGCEGGENAEAFRSARKVACCFRRYHVSLLAYFFLNFVSERRRAPTLDFLGGRCLHLHFLSALLFLVSIGTLSRTPPTLALQLHLTRTRTEHPKLSQ